jgi:hypothetical protein
MIEKAQPVLAGLEGAAGRPALAQAEQIAPHVLLAELIRRAAVMRRQPADRPDVDSPRSLS